MVTAAALSKAITAAALGLEFSLPVLYFVPVWEVPRAPEPTLRGPSLPKRPTFLSALCVPWGICCHESH